MAFQLSPGVNYSEIDLTTVVPAVSTTAGAFAGQFDWGPANQRILVTNEVDLVNKFGKPNSNTAVSFFTAANFLAYGNNLQVVRAANTNTFNAFAATNPNVANVANNIIINNKNDYETAYISDANNITYVARYPGSLGNSLRVSICDSNSNPSIANSVKFTDWEYRTRFPAAPNTTPFVAVSGGANDQFHLVVVDEDGLFSNGVKGTVLEVFPFLSKAIDCVGDDGTGKYYRTVIENQSQYIYMLGAPDRANTSNASADGRWGVTAANTSFCGIGNTAFQNVSFSGGASNTVTLSELATGYSRFNNTEEVDISLILTGDGGMGANSAIGANTVTVQQTIIDLAATRKDCVAFVSAPYGVVTNTAPATVVSDWVTTLARASNYTVADCGWKYQFDKYNNVYRWIPLNGDIAGLCVRTDQTNDPWFSPAGVNRGAIKNVVKLAWNPNQAQRDTIYSIGVNPVISLPGQGTILYGDKTFVTQPSAFDRINVRRLFLVLEKAIVSASKYSLFEMNDEFTRSQFISLVEPYLRDIKGRRGIYDYRVVCDNTNNTPQVIDSNQFVGDIYIKPARSINFIQLNFVAARTGVNFNEIVGAV
jgi:phage tail sheath protein FI